MTYLQMIMSWFEVRPVVMECYKTLVLQGVSAIRKARISRVSEIGLTLSGLRVGTKMGTKF